MNIDKRDGKEEFVLIHWTDKEVSESKKAEKGKKKKKRGPPGTPWT